METKNRYTTTRKTIHFDTKRINSPRKSYNFIADKENKKA